MRFTLGCELGYRLASECLFVLNVQAARFPQQTILSETLTLTPELEVEPYDMTESGNRYVRFKAPKGQLSVGYKAEVELEVRRDDQAAIGVVPVAELPFEVLPHLYPSRYCQADRLVRLAQQEFGQIPPGHEQVTAICNWINDHVAYVRGTSDVHTSAGDTLVERAGVCRDFAHLGIALCRALGIPARFVSSYAWRLDPQDFHAVFEAYLGGRWYLFDATRQAALDGLVRIGVGRDAAEVAFTSIYGDVEPTAMRVFIGPSTGEPPSYTPTVDAISTSRV